MNSEPLSYTIKDACKMSGLSRSFLYAAIADGRLQRIKVGTRTLIMRSDLVKFLEDGKEMQ